MRLLLLLALPIALVSGCSKKEEPASRGPAPMGEAERKRGEDACLAYVARLCACAEDKGTQELKDRCELHKGRPDTVATALSAEGSPEVSPMDIAQAQDAARKVIAACVQDMTKLDGEGCP